MADDAEKQRRIEEKRAYNRRLSAMKRQQVKDDIAALAAKAEMHKDRADKLEKKNTELLEQVRVLSEANQQLTERVQLLTAAGYAAPADGVGLTSGPPPYIATQRGLTQSGAAASIGRPDLTSALGSGAMMGGSLGGSGANQRYLQLGGLLHGTTAGIGGLDRLLGSNNSISASMVPQGGRPPRDNMANMTHCPFNQQELNLFIRLNDASRNQSNLIPRVPAPNAAAFSLSDGSSSGAQSRDRRGGISGNTAAAINTAPSVLDSLLARLLATEQANRPRSNNSEAAAAASMIVPADIQARMILLNQSSLFSNTDPPSMGAAAGLLLPPPQSANNRGQFSIAEIEARERQLMLLALLAEVKQAEEESSSSRPSHK